MKRVILFVILTSLIIGGCESSTSVEPVSEPYNLEDQLQKVNFTQTDYSTVLIESQDSLLIPASEFNSRPIKHIIAGYTIEGFSVATDTLTPRYAAGYKDNIILGFRFTLNLPRLLYNTTVWVKYLLINNDSVNVFKDFFLLSYPYKSTNLILPYRYYITYTYIQDFAFQNELIYYKPYGPDGLYSYNLKTHEKRLLYDYYGGSSIGADSGYVFMDVDLGFIKRYDIGKDTITKELNLQPILGNSVGITGIAVNSPLVYVITIRPEKILTLNEDLEVLSIRDFVSNNSFYRLTYSKGFLYTIDFGHSPHYQILKINEASLEITEQKMPPVEAIGSIKVYDGRLVCTDDNRFLFCSTQLDEIF